MKLTTLLLILTIMQVCAKVKAQKVTLSTNNTSLSIIFQQIRSQTGYDFAYTTKTLENTNPVTINVKNKELGDVLNQIFDGQPVEYSIEDKLIVISVKQPTVLDKLRSALNLDAIDVHGQVVDENGQSLQGVTIRLKDEGQQTITDKDGYFTIKSVQKNAVLLLSFVGYLTKEVKAATTLGIITLERSNSKLDEVQVIAYGKESKRFSVGAVSTVTAEDIEKQPVTDVLLALQGQVAGLNVTPLGGQPGANAQIQVRGQNEISSIHSQPLFIVDGVPYSSQNSNSSAITSTYSLELGNYQGVNFSAINGINPHDIESITVLKDADATSIYGSRGADGVILITTKKGKAGKDLLAVSVNSGYNSDARPIKLLNTQQYLQIRKQAYQNDNLTPDISAPDLTLFDQNKDTDWEKLIFGKTTHYSDGHVSLSGGTENNTFLTSAGFTRSDFNYPGNYADQRLSFHNSFHHQSPNKRLTIDAGVDYSYDDNTIPNNISTQDVLNPPNLPNLINPDGSLLWNYKGADIGAYQFYAYQKKTHQLQNYNLQIPLAVTYKFTPDLSFTTTAGYSRTDGNETYIEPAASEDPTASYPRSVFTPTLQQTINIEPQLNYTHKIGKGDFSALLGGTYEKIQGSGTLFQGTGYPSDALMNSLDGATSITAYTINYNQNKYLAAFGRLKYVYDQKYIISLTGNRDGSSNFGPGRQYANFGSAALGWIMSEENWFKQALPFIDFAKLSGSYGTTGSQGSSYQYQSFYSINNYAYTPFQGNIPLQAENLENSVFGWAEKKSLNLALDLSLLHSRLNINATYFRDREGNQLINYPLASQAGFSSVYANLNATVQNKGWEFTVSSKNISSKDFRWTTNFNITLPNNKLIAFPGLANSSYSTSYAIGHSTSIVNRLKYKDVNPQTGLFEFYNASGQVTSSPDLDYAVNGGDLTSIVDLQPKFYGGIGNNFAYKNFGLSVFFQFSKQMAPNYLSTVYVYGSSPGSSAYGLTNEPAAVFNKFWTAPGDNAQLQKLTSQFSYPAYYFSYSTAAYSDDTYLRLKTLSLSYTLPDLIFKKVGFSNFKVYANVQNLLTFTDYKVGDPELPGGIASFPIQRTLVFGLSFNL